MKKQLNFDGRVERVLGARGGHCWQAQATPATASALPSEMAVDTTMSAPAPASAFTAPAAVFTGTITTLPSFTQRSGSGRARIDGASLNRSTYLLAGVKNRCLCQLSGRRHDLVVGGLSPWPRVGRLS